MLLLLLLLVVVVVVVVVVFAVVVVVLSPSSLFWLSSSCGIAECQLEAEIDIIPYLKITCFMDLH